MTIKELAYSTQQHLKARTGVDFKRAHIYELLAALFGFKSYAALGADAVFTEQRSTNRLTSASTAAIQLRCVALGYQPDIANAVSLALLVFVAERQIGVVRILDLVSELRGESAQQDGYFEGDDELYDQDDVSTEDPCENPIDLDLNSPILLDDLESAASKGNALAHYAIALIHASDEDEAEHSGGSEYWYSQAQQGRVLTGVEKEWADAHAVQLVKAAKYAHHLREAARLGQQDALLDLADQFEDPAFFEQEGSQFEADPAFVAAIAGRLNRPNDARKWLTAAAEAGDTDAMRQLIEDYDHGDLQRCWIWIYLAELLGENLTKDEHYAIHEDGSHYDDDVGGNIFVGGRDGVDINPLNAEQDAAARRAAQAIFQCI